MTPEHTQETGNTSPPKEEAPLLPQPHCTAKGRSLLDLCHCLDGIFWRFIENPKEGK